MNMSDQAKPNGSTIKPVKICPILPCSKEGNRITPTPCLQGACALYARVTDEHGNVVTGECSIMLLPSVIGMLPLSYLQARRQVGLDRGEQPIIRPVG